MGLIPLLASVNVSGELEVGKEPITRIWIWIQDTVFPPSYLPSQSHTQRNDKSGDNSPKILNFLKFFVNSVLSFF